MSQADPRTPTILFNEDDASLFESSPNNVKSGAPRLARTCLQLMNRHNTDPRVVCEVLLAPIKESPGCPALDWSDHGITN